jgi:Family of unknown function (DUF5995)
MDARGIVNAIGRVPVPWRRVPVPWSCRHWWPGQQPGDIRKLADIARAEVHSTPDVVDRLEAIRQAAVATSPNGERNGIACFAKLYRIITENVGDTEFEDPEFLARLDLEFARRYLRALVAYVQHPTDAPLSWRTQFDLRDDSKIAPVQFAAAGVNAHINFDLTGALLETWKAFPPNDARHRDYEKVNDIFEARVDGLRETFQSLLSAGEDGAVWDRFANWACDLLIRFTRDLAWDRALEVWHAPDVDRATADMLARLDVVTWSLGNLLLATPILPV